MVVIDAHGLVNKILIKGDGLGIGEGKYQADGTIEWDYTLMIGGYKEECNAIYSR